MKKTWVALACAMILLGISGCANKEQYEPYITNGQIDEKLLSLGYKAECDDEQCIITNKKDIEFKVTKDDLSFFTYIEDPADLVYSLDIKSISYKKDGIANCVLFVGENTSEGCTANEEQALRDVITVYQDLLKKIGIDENKMIEYLKGLNKRKDNDASEFLDTSKVTKPDLFGEIDNANQKEKTDDNDKTGSDKEEKETSNEVQNTKPSELRSSETTGQKNAKAKAYSYLNYSAFSYSGLVDQLIYEGFSNEDAAYGVDNCGADWSEQALKKAKEYLNYSSFSYTGLLQQLEYEKFTNEQATYAVNNCGADWSEQAVKKANDYMKYTSFSRQGLLDQLVYEGFSQEQAEYGVTSVGY